jgi:hypothetical protein
MDQSSKNFVELLLNLAALLTMEVFWNIGGGYLLLLLKNLFVYGLA